MNINNLKYDKFICGEQKTEAQVALIKMLENENVGVSYADMMRYRTSNKAFSVCCDTYYVAHENEKAYSRLWNGWGKHENAIGNFGNFVTVEELRGKGIGHKMLEVWHEDIYSRQDLPLCFLCMGDKRAAKLYFPYGFTTIEKGAEWGPLYMPLGNSPKDFYEMCDLYYQPSPNLFLRDATVEWRHEIDCLLKYCLMTRGLDYTINGKTLEHALLYQKGEAQLFFTENGRCVGWALDGITRLHPQYQNSSVIVQN